MKPKSTFLARDALPSPTLEPGGPHADGPGLPISIDGSNISLERAVIRWCQLKGRRHCPAESPRRVRSRRSGGKYLCQRSSVCRLLSQGGNRGNHEYCCCSQCVG